MKLLLINPVSVRSYDMQYPPLSLGTIASMSDCEVELIDENMERFEYRDADLVAISIYTPAAPRAYHIAKIYRDNGIPVIVGGIHPTIVFHEAMEYADSVVIGDAEGVWKEVLDDFKCGKLKKIYKSRLSNLNGLPIPDRSLFGNYKRMSIQTSRGCPNICSFCTTPIRYVKYMKRPTNEILDELESISEKDIFFVDDNLFCRGKDLFQGMIDRGIYKNWWCQSSMLTGLDNELLNLYARSGCKLILLGVESENKEALGTINKTVNQRIGVEQYGDIFKNIHNHGIKICGSFIYGLDTDTKDKLYERTHYIANSDIDCFQIYPLSPSATTFSGFGDRILYRNFPEDWCKYNGCNVVVKPKLMSVNELEEALCYAHNILRHKKNMTVRYANDDDSIIPLEWGVLN